MKSAHFLEWVGSVINAIVGEESLYETFDLFGWGCYVGADTDIFSWLSESACEFVIDPREEHLVDEEDEFE